MPEIKLILGDCLVELKKLKAESMDLIFADPPYNLSGEKSLGKCRERLFYEEG